MIIVTTLISSNEGSHMDNYQPLETTNAAIVHVLFVLLLLI
jgi:hypothetical protein